MGLPYGLEKIRDWRSQYDRMLRWQKRTQTLTRVSHDDLLDFYLAFFQTRHHLQEWIAKSKEAQIRDLRERAKENEYMQLCRDICNRSKHFIINAPSVDATFSIAREYRRGESKPSLVVLASGNKVDLDEAVEGCIRFWNSAISDLGIT